MSMAATAAVPLDVLGGEIIACIERVFRDQRKSDEWRATAQQKLQQAFRATGGGAAFEAFLLPLCEKIKVIQDDSGVPMPLSLSYAYEIMAKTPEESRADWRDQQARKRASDADIIKKAKAKTVPTNSMSHGKTDKPLKSPTKTPSLPHKVKTQPQLLAAFRKCVKAMTLETRREALAYLVTEI